jgi:DNA repair exonuclease SbcCD ATPase subunit
MVNERIAKLTECREQYKEMLTSVRAKLPMASGVEATALARRDAELQRKIEQCNIEIRFLQDHNGLIEDYRRQYEDALTDRNNAQTAEEREAFQRRADFCLAVTADALHMATELRPLPPGVLETIESDLHQAATIAKNTVDAINQAISVLNTVLDGLIMLARVAEKIAVA